MHRNKNATPTGTIKSHGKIVSCHLVVFALHRLSDFFLVRHMVVTLESTDETQLYQFQLNNWIKWITYENGIATKQKEMKDLNASCCILGDWPNRSTYFSFNFYFALFFNSLNLFLFLCDFFSGWEIALQNLSIIINCIQYDNQLQLTYDKTVNFTAIPKWKRNRKIIKNGLNIKIKKKTSHFWLTLINYQKLFNKTLDFFYENSS